VGGRTDHNARFPLSRERLDNLELSTVGVSESRGEKTDFDYHRTISWFAGVLWVFWGQSAGLNILENRILHHAFPFIWHLDYEYLAH
jgi:hypothetical protein